MGIWVWDYSQVWMASVDQENVSHVNILDVNTNTIRQLEPKNGIPVLNPNGGGYYDGKVYMASNGNSTYPSCIYAVDPLTHDVEVMVDSYFGLRLNGPNYLVWASRETPKGCRSWLFFTDDFLNQLYEGGPGPQLPDATWCFGPIERTLLPVIDRTDVLVPNGIRVNKDGTRLYVTNTPSPLTYGAGVRYLSGGAETFTGRQSSAIYVFNIDNE